MSVLPSPLKLFFDKVEKLLFKYFWSKNPDQIKRCVLYSSREDGGIAMRNTTIQTKSLKVSWIQRLLNQPETKWAKLALRFLPPGGTAIFKGNISSKDIICSKLWNNGFWKNVLLHGQI